MNKPPILEVVSVYKSFHCPQTVEVLKEVNLSLFQGESLAIMGPSGVGKSTLLHLLGTLEEPTSGQILIEGKKAEASFRKTHIGFVFQNFHLLEDFTTLENVLMPIRISRLPVHQLKSTALKLLDQVGLKNRADFSVKLLSGGEKQRVAIARALINHPKILLADEPTGNLDAKTSKQIFDLLISLCKENQIALVVVTHDKELASLLDRRIRLIGLS
ncbi:MAG: ABC transporter ATP-binding protein [Simkaniaceae bacterium]